MSAVKLYVLLTLRLRNLVFSRLLAHHDFIMDEELLGILHQLTAYI